MAKKTLLCLHGALGTVQDFAPVANALAENFDIKLLNFSGHGTGTYWPKEFRIETFAQELEDFFKEHSLKEVAVFGYSMGGYVALYHRPILKTLLFLIFSLTELSLIGQKNLSPKKLQNSISLVSKPRSLILLKNFKDATVNVGNKFCFQRPI